MLTASRNPPTRKQKNILTQQLFFPLVVQVTVQYPMFRATLASTLANLTSYAADDAEVLLFLDTLPVYVDLAGSEEDTNGTMSFFSMQSQ